RVRSEELGRRGGGRLLSLSLPPPRPPLGSLPGGSGRGSVAAVSGGQRDLWPGPPVREGFFVVPPPPSEGARTAAKQRYQSPPREEEEPGLQPQQRLDPPPFFPHLSTGPAGFGGSRGGDSGRARVQVNLVFSRGSRSQSHH
ncbi:hypothetical protein MC885_019222, partial [Smutsia gigantea]